jgi:ribonuclease HI
MRFKKNKVWVAVDCKGIPIQQKGKLLIKYQLEQKHEYWVNPANVSSLEDKTEISLAKRLAPLPRKVPDRNLQESEVDQVHIYTDGASSGNPGPAGIGILLEYKGQVKEISKFIGQATNNVAELEAIRTGLLELNKKDLPIVVYTDSSYAQGVLTLGWKARKNRGLVDKIRELIGSFKDVKLVKVRGHAGHPQNERADQLARMAVASGRSSH